MLWVNILAAIGKAGVVACMIHQFLLINRPEGGKCLYALSIAHVDAPNYDVTNKQHYGSNNEKHRSINGVCHDGRYRQEEQQQL